MELLLDVPSGASVSRIPLRMDSASSGRSSAAKDII
jgi:hypothetical protein